MNKRQQLYGSPSQWTGPQGHTVLPCETLTGIPPGPQRAQWYLRDHLNPSVFYCLVSGSEWISEKLNIQIKTKIKESGISSHRLFQGVKDKVLKTSVGTTRRETLHLPRLGARPLPLQQDFLSHSLKFTWKPTIWRKTHILGNRTERAKHTCLWETWPPT